MSVIARLRTMDMSARDFRRLVNVWPSIAGTGVRVTLIADDFTEVRIRLKLGWRTYNAFGTIFGGSLYGASDPWFTLMLVKQLGPQYVVWDKSAAIRFVKPATGVITGSFSMPPEEAEAVRREADKNGSCVRTYSVDLVNRTGDICAQVEKTIYVARKDLRVPRSQ